MLARPVDTHKDFAYHRLAVFNPYFQRTKVSGGVGMSGAWYALATIAVAIVIWRYIRNDGPNATNDSGGVPKTGKKWRSGDRS